MNGSTWATLIPLVVLLLVMYFLLIRPQKKREKQVNEMRSNVRVGDEIITIGGICGKIVKTKEESLIIQVGADKVKFEVMRWAVSKVVENARATKKVSAPAPSEEDEGDTPRKAKPKRLKKKSDAAAEEPAGKAAPTEKEDEKPDAEKPASEQPTEASEDSKEEAAPAEEGKES